MSNEDDLEEREKKVREREEAADNREKALTFREEGTPTPYDLKNSQEFYLKEYESLRTEILQTLGDSRNLERLVTDDDASRGKPDPEPYELGASKLGLDTLECLVIENSPAGIKAGKVVGCKTLAVLSSHPMDALVEADWIVASRDHVFAIPAHDGMIAIHCNSARCFP